MSHTPAGFLIQQQDFTERSATYVVFVPPTYSPDQDWPAIVLLHGMGESGTDGLKQVSVGLGTAIQRDIEAWPFIVLMPQKPDRQSKWAEHEAMVMKLLDRTREEYRVDPDRIYLTGLSQGGYGTWAIGARHSDLFAALAPVCGGGDPATADRLAKMPIWCFHGETDEAVPVARSQEMVSAVEAAGGRPKLTIYPGVGHNSWDKAYRDEGLAGWLLEHRRR